ncbi:HipA domain-containing protein [Sinorhizobium sp. 7-81]|uniref:HipA domain-containing protein n=1 Tax=Sinorhizobium sp. 8-89 TaxID=3049089 RepID=UPI0024C26A9A|nr:HipA domain-containing protein [Sinorhizobium sp. 8-89]MDK1493002.1 HipA domain-containing protein [Sinorhizobium sp. 8-89]
MPGDHDVDYRRIDDDRLNAIIGSLHRRQRRPEGTEDPSPLAGVQSKIAITILPDGSYAEPVTGSGAPTTHIIKVPDQEHPQDPKLEFETLRLSRDLGFATAEASVVNFNGVDALVIERFDRRLNAENKIVRVHQEDFAQALGLPPSLKYERHGREGRRFDAHAINRILDATTEPAAERQRFIGAVLFDLMTGNVDAHAKNFALLYDRAGRIRVSPRYDLMPTRLDPNLTDLFAFSLGEATRLAELDFLDFAAFLNALGIALPRAQTRLTTSLTQRISAGLAAKLPRLDRIGLKRFGDLIAHNIDELLTAFEMQVPDGIKARDAYVERGGEWLLGS